jgi:hypothetical protein
VKQTLERSGTQNVTLALPRGVLTRVKVLAAERGTSISALLTGLFEQAVDEDDAYGRARQRGLSALDRPVDLGTRGRRPASRDALHER